LDIMLEHILQPVAWQPKELLDVGLGCQCGIITDDGCYMVLIHNWDGLCKPTSWIPMQVAKRLGELANHCRYSISSI